MSANLQPTRTPADWAIAITARWQESFKAIVDVGKMLIAAKADLPHGEFTIMAEQDLPFKDISTAQRLMKVANDSRLTNAAHVQLLPSSWGTLYELTKLDDDTWALALDRGLIRVDIARNTGRRKRPVKNTCRPGHHRRTGRTKPGPGAARESGRLNPQPARLLRAAGRLPAQTASDRVK